MIMLNKGFDQVAKSMDSFSKGMGELQSEISKDTERSNRESAKREKINKENLNKIWGSSKSNVKIWGDK